MVDDEQTNAGLMMTYTIKDMNDTGRGTECCKLAVVDEHGTTHFQCLVGEHPQIQQQRCEEWIRSHSTPTGTTITDQTYFVVYADHPKGSPAGFFTREGIDVAERSSTRMSECGYRFTEVRHAASVFEFSNGWAK